jgi:glutathione S-transferase/GST-like protein
MADSARAQARPVVHTWDPNSNSGKPLFVLNEKQVAFEHHYVDLLEFEQHSPDYLRNNPRGTVPALLHAGLILTESTPMAEYIDAAFAGPSLSPASAAARYQMRRWCRLSDMAAESVSVIGWHRFLGPMARSKSKEEFARILARIPTKERRISWLAAVEGRFTEKQLSDARAAVGAFVRKMDDTLARQPWLAAEQFSLADILTFTNFYALPLSFPEFSTEAYAPHVLEWLRRIYERPATMQTFGLARSIAKRAFEVRDLLGAPRQRLS